MTTVLGGAYARDEALAPAGDPGYVVGGRVHERRWSLDEVARAIASGRLSPHTLVWSPGMADWRPASDVAEISLAVARTRASTPLIAEELRFVAEHVRPRALWLVLASLGTLGMLVTALIGGPRPR